MRIDVVTDPDRPRSIDIYMREIISRLSERGATFSIDPPRPEGDLLWAPCLGMRRIPEALHAARAPVVTTVHGLVGLSMSLRELGLSPGRLRYILGMRLGLRRDWRRLMKRGPRIIAVSDWGAAEIERALGPPPGVVTRIYHGVDVARFARDTGAPVDQRFVGAVLHVSQYQRKKNIERLVAAYADARDRIAAPLVIISIGCPPLKTPPGCEILSRGLPHSDLPAVYRAARAFAFPSLHETFGLPILEAMAAGLPVLTSADGACAEIAGGAAFGYRALNPQQDAAYAPGAVLGNWGGLTAYLGEILDQDINTGFAGVTLMPPNEWTTRFFVTPVADGAGSAASQRDCENCSVSIFLSPDKAGSLAGMYDRDTVMRAEPYAPAALPTSARNVVCTGAVDMTEILPQSVVNQVANQGGWGYVQIRPGTSGNVENSATVLKLEFNLAGGSVTSTLSPDGATSFTGTVNNGVWLRNNGTPGTSQF